MSVLSPENKSIIIAEVAQAHDGSLGQAHAYIDAAANAGADAIKFQVHIASAESTREEQWRVKFSPQDEARYDYWKRMEFSAEQWHGLKKHALDKSLLFVCSPFSNQAVTMMYDIGVDIWKIASGEINNLDMLEEISNYDEPVLLSSGMSSWDEIDVAVNFLKEKGVNYGVMQCSSIYPTPANKVGLNNINEMKERYDCAVGLSDHSGTIFSGLAATTLGANILEVHVTFDKNMFGPDTSSSITFHELVLLKQGVSFIEDAMHNPVEKNTMASELDAMRKLFNKSIVAKNDLSKGEVLKKEDVIFKKPGTGIPASDINEFIGKKIRNNIDKDALLKKTDFT